MIKVAQRELKPIQGCSGRRRRSTVALVSPASLCPPLSSMVEPNPKKELHGPQSLGNALLCYPAHGRRHRHEFEREEADSWLSQQPQHHQMGL